MRKGSILKKGDKVRVSVKESRLNWSRTIYIVNSATYMLIDGDGEIVFGLLD